MSRPILESKGNCRIMQGRHKKEWSVIKGINKSPRSKKNNNKLSRDNQVLMSK